MDSKPAQPTLFDATILSRLGCPTCLGDLRPDETRLICTGCGRGYPIVDGIPVLIAAHAETAK
jgi:hypothetical protein